MTFVYIGAIVVFGTLAALVLYLYREGARIAKRAAPAPSGSETEGDTQDSAPRTS